MHKVRVGVIRGGDPLGYEKSLKTGEMVMKHLPSDHYDIHDIFITKDGAWHRHGLEIAPHTALAHLDVAWNALHGTARGDSVEHILELHKIPFTGSGIFPSALTSHPVHFKEALKREGLKTLPYRLVEIPDADSPGESLTDLFRTFAPPIILRPVVQMCEPITVRTYGAFPDALSKAFEVADSVMLEEFIPGTPISVGVIEGYRDHDIYALPPVSPLQLTHEEKRLLEDTARRVHNILGLRHYSQVDLNVTPKRGVFVVGVTLKPELHEESVFHKALHSVGAPLWHFFDHTVRLALGRK